MPSEPGWVAPEEVEQLNRLAVDHTGEPFLLLDSGLLESACARPRNHWANGETRIGVMAAYLLMGIARNHAFQQGNKRAALLAANAFIIRNKHQLVAPDDALAELIIAMVEREISDDAFVRTFSAMVGPLPPRRVRTRAQTIKESMGRFRKPF